ncbi:hypothetical protein [Methylomonas sp. MK1]|uniref:hypothetical protein n=1 Tax=Methylomonas sp. MK1 TaxID=1131552 RepID=UPI001267C9A4|nr:hypothetical protein [Methylomonas sp. MK1]
MKLGIKNLLFISVNAISMVTILPTAKADCLAAQQVCEDARKKAAECLDRTKIACGPILEQKISACNQADFTCEKERSISRPCPSGQTCAGSAR